MQHEISCDNLQLLLNCNKRIHQSSDCRIDKVGMMQLGSMDLRPAWQGITYPPPLEAQEPVLAVEMQARQGTRASAQVLLRTNSRTSFFSTPESTQVKRLSLQSWFSSLIPESAYTLLYCMAYFCSKIVIARQPTIYISTTDEELEQKMFAGPGKNESTAHMSIGQKFKAGECSRASLWRFLDWKYCTVDMPAGLQKLLAGHYM